MMDRIAMADDFFSRKKLSGSIQGLNKATADCLRKAGIMYASEMLQAGCNKVLRQQLAEKTGLDDETILYLVKCSDLMRLTGVSGKTLQYLYDSGFDTVDRVRKASPEHLREVIRIHMKSLGLKGSMPSCCDPGEVVRVAMAVPDVVEYE